MKQVLYRVFALFFAFGKLCPLKKNYVALVSPHNASFNDSLGEIKGELDSRGGYTFLLISGREIKGTKNPFSILGFLTVKAFRLARAEYIFLNDNFMPLAFVTPKKGVTVTQLWHGEGAFKKSGFDIALTPETEALEHRVCERYTYMICSSPEVVPVYASVFAMDESRVLPLGSARTDKFFRCSQSDARRQIEAEYPQAKGKKIVLYAPTFRDNHERDARLMEGFDIDRFNAAYGDGSVLFVRLHPQVHSPADMTGAVDVTDYPDAGLLLCAADVLITDYSSIIMDFALLNRPCIFYAPDLEEYIKDRDFYGKYDDIVPGPVVKTFDGLLDALSDPRADTERLEAFRKYHLGACDGGSAKRIADRICG